MYRVGKFTLTYRAFFFLNSDGWWHGGHVLKPLHLLELGAAQSEFAGPKIFKPSYCKGSLEPGLIPVLLTT